MRIATVVGIILIGVGILSLAYFASPVRFMIDQLIGPQDIHLLAPILGGVALVGGIALLYVTGPGRSKL